MKHFNLSSSYTYIYIYIYTTRIIASLNSSFHCFEFHNTRFVIYFSLYTVSKIIILFRIFFWRLIFVTTTVKTLSSTSTNFARVIRYVQRPVFVGRNYGGGERQGKFLRVTQVSVFKNILPSASEVGKRYEKSRFFFFISLSPFENSVVIFSIK